MGYEKSEYVTWKRLEGGRGVLLDLKSGRYYTLNETATMVWDLAATHMPVDRIAEKVSETFRADLAEVEADVRALVDMLSDKGFLQKTALGVVDGAAVCESEKAYQKPAIEEHEAIKEVTAGSRGASCSTTSSCGSSSCGTVHYWYPN